MALSVEALDSGRQIEVVQGLAPIINRDNGLFKAPELDSKWQPADFIPDPGRDGVRAWENRARVIRRQAQTLSPAFRVVIAGDLITEEALATYAMALARLPGLEDINGIDDRPFSVRRRSWLGDEKRHGEVLSDWAKLSAVFDIRAIQRANHRLILNGFDNEAGPNLYPNVIFVVKQERFTGIAHRNSKDLAEEQQAEAGVEGKSVFGEISGEVAKEEDIHHAGYLNLLIGIAKEDAPGLVIAYRDMMVTTIHMPAKFIGFSDGSRSTKLFEEYAKAANYLGILTLQDNWDVDDKVIKRIGLAGMSLSGEAAEAQEQIFKIHEDDKGRAERIESFTQRLRTAHREPDVTHFDWLLKKAA